ncbi:MAG: hypothetical protein Q8M26_01945 [Pseudolabrys sp.]|nr:hypothetical protein [Pseudolabrys sp.]
MLRSLILALGLAAAPAAIANTPSPADIAWLERCAGQLKRERGDPAVVRRYCACMHQQFENNEPVGQSEMERLYPPMHRHCLRKAGWD